MVYRFFPVFLPVVVSSIHSRPINRSQPAKPIRAKKTGALKNHFRVPRGRLRDAVVIMPSFSQNKRIAGGDSGEYTRWDKSPDHYRANPNMRIRSLWSRYQQELMIIISGYMF